MKVLITREIPRAGIDILRKRPQLELDIRKGSPLSDKDLKKAIVGVDAIVPVIPDKVTKEVLEAAGPQLKLVAAYSVGYDHIDVPAATSMGIYVSNTPGDLTQAVAEHSFALLMAVARKVVAADRFVADGKYKYWDPMIFLGPTLQGNTIGIIGMGRIGQRMAKIAKGGFDMKVLYHDVTRNDKVEMESGALYVSLDDLLERSDFVSLHVPLMPATHHLIGRNELKKMRPTAILVNTSRGPVIDEDALNILSVGSRGTARVGLRLLRRVRDFAQSNNNSVVDSDTVKSTMELLNIDDLGLEGIDREILRVIYNNFDGGPVGVSTLAASISEEVSTVLDVHEPYLMKLGLLKRTSRGRVLTPKGIKYVEGIWQ